MATMKEPGLVEEAIRRFYGQAQAGSWTQQKRETILRQLCEGLAEEVA